MNDESFRKKLMLLTLPKLQKKADTLFQKRRRLEESIGEGVVRCISCGTFGDLKRFDAGHFIPRHHLGTRYVKNNVWPQDKKCNRWLHGNHAKYRENLVKKIGKDKVEDLESLKDKVPSIGMRNWCIEVILESKKIISEKER